MSHRSRRPDDRDHRSHSSNKYDRYDKHEYRHYRDDSRERSDRHYGDDSRDRPDRYHSKRSSGRDSRYRSGSRSPSHSSRRHHRSRSGSRHRHSRSRSHGHGARHHHDGHHGRSQRSKDYREPDTRERHDSREHSQSKHNSASHEKSDSINSSHQEKSKYNSSSQCTERGPTSISHQFELNGNATDEPKNTKAIDPNDPDAVLEEEKQRVQRETLERLQKHFEKEGKSYPPPKPQASHPIFANDGSFLEMFKSMQQGNLQQQTQQQTPQLGDTQSQLASVEPAVPSKSVPTTSTANPIARLLPVKRRGAKILKTGIVQKQRITEENDEAQPSDSWNAYLKEVKRYKTVTCSDDNMTRSLVK